MAGCVHFFRKLGRRKIFTDDDIESTDLNRCLTTLDLIGLGKNSLFIVSCLSVIFFLLGKELKKNIVGPAQKICAVGKPLTKLFFRPYLLVLMCQIFVRH